LLQVGIIMYLPEGLAPSTHAQRAAVTDAFMQYRKLCAHQVLRAESFLPPKKGTVCLFASRACFFL
jgi:hypothetical protein